MSTLGSSAASVATSTPDEYVRLKHELAQTRARTDKNRIEARQLISQRDGLKSDVAKETGEVEEKQLILEETLKGMKRLKEQIEVAKGEKDVLTKKIERWGKFQSSSLQITAACIIGAPCVLHKSIELITVANSFHQGVARRKITTCIPYKQS